MKPQVVLVALGVLAVLAALPLAQSSEHGIGERVEDVTAGAWPCCDNCGWCARTLPPKCVCDDISPRGCHPGCKKCAKTTVDGEDVFYCEEVIKNFCQRRCTPPRPAA